MKKLLFYIEKAYNETCTDCCAVRIFSENVIVTYYKTSN